MIDVKTIVYFDLEATGLKSSGMPRICELSFVAVNIQDVPQLGSKINEDKNFCEHSFVPRVINKLTLCIYPMAIIVPLVSDLTGLDNYNLSGQSNFNKTTVDLINTFLSSLPSPVCLTAHNGNAYDFPLLTAELKKIGMHLNPDILCADSLPGIKEIFEKMTDKESGKRKKLSEKFDINAEIVIATELFKAGMFETEIKEGQIVTYKTASIQQTNELTPKKNPICDILIKNIKIRKDTHSEDSNTKKRLRYINQNIPSSFSLVNLHKHIFGIPPVQSHGAESDCLALLRITSTLGSEWINWIKNSCSTFSSCKKMWG